MKKIMLCLAFLMSGVCAFSQENHFQEIHGTVRSDGFQNITMGAFWSSRPKAKEVYEGLYPSGVEIILFNSDYFVRFANEEHNNKDLNYIVFPKGEKIYKDLWTGRYYAAVCGNEIEFFQPVAETKISGDQITSVHLVDTVNHRVDTYDTVVHHYVEENYNNTYNNNTEGNTYYGNGQSYGSLEYTEPMMSFSFQAFPDYQVYSYSSPQECYERHPCHVRREHHDGDGGSGRDPGTHTDPPNPGGSGRDPGTHTDPPPTASN